MTHHTYEQRFTIGVLLKASKKKAEIASTIGKHPSVIGREIKRNKNSRNGQYDPSPAERKYRKRIKEKPRHKRFAPFIKSQGKSIY